MKNSGIRAVTIMMASLAAMVLLFPEDSRAGRKAGTPPLRKPNGTFFTLDTSSCQAAVSDGSSLWVSCYGDVKAVYAIEAATGKRTGRIDFGRDFPGGVAFDGKHLWVQSGGKAGYYLNKIDVTSQQIITRLSYGKKGGAAIGFDGVHLWVTNDTKALRVNTRTGTVDATVPLPVNSYIKSMAFDGNSIWMLDSVNGNLFRIDPSSAKLTGKLVLDPSPRMNSMAYDGSHLWVAGRMGKLVYKIDPRAVRIVKTINGDDGGGVVFDGRNIWVSHYTDNGLLSRIEPASARIIDNSELMIFVYNLVTVSGKLWIVSDGGLFRMPAGK